MSEPVNSMSQRVWQASPEPIEKFGVWSIRAGRYWKFNIVSQSWITANDAEKAALDSERYAKGLTVSAAIPVDDTTPQTSEGDEILSVKFTPFSWDNMKWCE